MKVCIFIQVFVLLFLHTAGQDPVRLPASTLGQSPGRCPSNQQTMNAKDGLRQSISTILYNLTTSPVNVTGRCVGTGWRRVGYLDMTNPLQSCPSGLALKYYSPVLRSCGRATNDTGGCWSTFYNTGTSQYREVCGRVRGYQFGATGAFHNARRGIDSYYVNGVSLTHGSSGSRTHIWTFAAGLSDTYGSQFAPEHCPCVIANAESPPSFVGNDYFCESGYNFVWDNDLRIFYPSNPLWDGQNCVSSCCQFNNPPYFTKILAAPTSNDLELRICCDTNGNNEDVPIDQVELFVR